jgi:F-type H+-transporting ATPase subunit b
VLNQFLTACELKNKVAAATVGGTAAPRRSAHRARRRAAVLVAMLLAFSSVAAYAGAQEHAPASASQAATSQAEQHAPAEAEHHDESIGGMIMAMGWPVANFIIFVGILYYFLNQPIRDYLATRSSTIRKDLVEAAELKAAATAQLASIEQKLQALPGELNKLRTRGADDIKAEEARIAAQAAADRERLLEQTRREIDLQVRIAKQEILEHAANLSVQLASERIKKEVTPADHDRLVDRYLSQVKEQQ